MISEEFSWVNTLGGVQRNVFANETFYLNWRQPQPLISIQLELRAYVPMQYSS